MCEGGCEDLWWQRCCWLGRIVKLRMSRSWPKAMDGPDGEDQVSVTMAMQADSFFSFNRSIYGTYGLRDNVALAVRSTCWTMISAVGVYDNVPSWKRMWA